jgi:hypothetical protein
MSDDPSLADVDRRPRSGELPLDAYGLLDDRQRPIPPLQFRPRDGMLFQRHDQAQARTHPAIFVTKNTSVRDDKLKIGVELSATPDDSRRLPRRTPGQEELP